MRGIAVALVGALGLACGSAAAAQAGAEDLLLRMSAAMRALNYQGSFIYEHDGRTDALRVFHLGGPHERERLISLTGPRSEIVRNGNTITCIQAGGQPTIFTNAVSPMLVPLVPDAKAGALDANYAVSLGGEDRIAGYNAQIVEVAARDGYRYGYRLWLDQASRLLLRSVVIDARRRPLEQFMFVALEVGSKPSETDLLPGNTGGKARTPADEVALTGAPRWRVTDLPAGFVLARSQRPVHGPAGAEHLIYSDGLASVSVYIEPRGNKPADADAALSRGALNVYSRSGDGWHITALGDVPAPTVERLARSVSPVIAPPD
ncbi:MAG TPA: MucB/RseB C-terminal domain-containing protein [Rhodanobacteraceae bacterium]|nr:MucB/RseB C-terminal domain-containing protein [Rhodanobacteraceae bacterium]